MKSFDSLRHDPNITLYYEKITLQSQRRFKDRLARIAKIMKDKGGKRSLSTTSGDYKTVNSKRHAPNLSSERGGVGSMMT